MPSPSILLIILAATLRGGRTLAIEMPLGRLQPPDAAPLPDGRVRVGTDQHC
jgi:hypothetical protein